MIGLIILKINRTKNLDIRVKKKKEIQVNVIYHLLSLVFSAYRWKSFFKVQVQEYLPILSGTKSFTENRQIHCCNASLR